MENTTGSYNIAIGRRAAQFNTTGIHNTTLGYYAGRFWGNNYADSFRNIFIGACAGYGQYGVSSGRDNIILGHKAGYCTEENIISNIFIGKCTGYHNGTANNIFVGDCAGFNTTYGNENIFKLSVYPVGDWYGLPTKFNSKLYVLTFTLELS